MGAEVSVLAPMTAKGTGYTGKTPRQMARERKRDRIKYYHSLIYDPKPFFFFLRVL